jgi:uncharacterized membrane protein
MRIVSAGHAVFAAVLVALGVQGLLKGDFTAVWDPVPKGVPLRHALPYLCALLSLSCGVGLLFERTASVAARALLASLLLWTVLFRVPPIARAPTALLPWDGCAETASIVAAAWVLYARFVDAGRLAFATGARGAKIARVVFGLALVPFGLAHLAYVKETASLVPAWLPAHVAIAYLTGATFLAAALSMLSGVLAPLAAKLGAAQLGLFTLLVWVPIVAAGSKNTYEWSEFAISCAITAAAWVVADSYRRDARRGSPPGIGAS